MLPREVTGPERVRSTCVPLSCVALAWRADNSDNTRHSRPAHRQNFSRNLRMHNRTCSWHNKSPYVTLKDRQSLAGGLLNRTPDMQQALESKTELWQTTGVVPLAVSTVHLVSVHVYYVTTLSVSKWKHIAKPPLNKLARITKILLHKHTNIYHRHEQKYSLPFSLRTSSFLHCNKQKV